ncbi:MAG TPA: NAD(P)-dependent oxidoreductase [Bacteroidales bacterium]|nr:NAD(P)-dependent oxidoreductase [Bacteroidales bacterium]
MKKKKILITGVSGFLGNKLALTAADRFDVYASTHKYPVNLKGVTSVKADLTDARQVGSLFEQVNPDMVFHLAAMSNPNQCEKNPHDSYEINVSATRNLVDMARLNETLFVFTSSDLVFEGKNAPYKEQDMVRPVNRYGRQKAEAEKSVLDYKAGTVCRMPLMFGEKSPYSGSFIQPMLQFLRANQKLNLFADEIRTPLSSERAAEGLLLIAEKRPKLIHLAGDEAVNRYEFGSMMCEMLGIGKELLIKRKLHEIEFEASRPENTSMDNSRAKSLGFNPGVLKEELRRVIEG